MKKYLSVLLTVLLLTTAFGCLSALAETEQETVPDSYEELDETEHTVTATVWEYPIVDGEHASGKPVDESTYTEAHTFEDGECIYCGYVKEEDEEEDKEEDNITALTAVAEASAEGEAAKEAAAEETAEAETEENTDDAVTDEDAAAETPDEDTADAAPEEDVADEAADENADEAATEEETAAAEGLDGGE